MFGEEVLQAQVEFAQGDAYSNEDGEGTQNVRLFREMTRKNAMNKFSVAYCEKIIQSFLDPQITKAKDSKNLYYKRIEKVCYENN